MGRAAAGSRSSAGSYGIWYSNCGGRAVEYRLNGKTVFRPWGLTGLAIVASLILALIAASALYHVHNGNMIGAAVSAVSLWLFWQVGWWSKVVVSQHGITVDSMFLRRRVSWNQLSDIGANGGLRFQLKDGTEFGTISYGDSLIGTLTRYRRLRHARDKMVDACNRYRAMPESGEWLHHHERRQQVVLSWWVLLTYAALFESIAITADLVSHAH
jgi:hypothetical protein